MIRKIFFGATCIIIAEFFFASSSMFVKILWRDYHISAFEASFARFILGFIVMFGYMLMTRVQLKPRNTKALISRGVLNALALFLYYYALPITTLTKANILNMTYPLFIAMLAPMLIKEKATLRTNLLVFVAFIGVYLVVNPRIGSVVAGDWYALMSGLAAALAIISLREARKTDTTFTVIFYLMTIGMLANLPFVTTFSIPHGYGWLLLILCGLFGFLGQVLLTIGYKTVVAVEGALASTSRIIFAAALGIMFFNEHITALLVIGTTLIVYATITIRSSEAH